MRLKDTQKLNLDAPKVSYCVPLPQTDKCRSFKESVINHDVTRGVIPIINSYVCDISHEIVASLSYNT